MGLNPDSARATARTRAGSTPWRWAAARIKASYFAAPAWGGSPGVVATTLCSSRAKLTGGAGIAGYFVLLFASIALWWAIGAGTGLGWAALIVAVLWAVVGAILFFAGRNSLRSVRGLPRTADTVKKIPDALKGNE